jgi:PKD repeat protein
MYKRLLASLFLTLFLAPQVLAFSLSAPEVEEAVELAEESPITAVLNANSTVGVSKSIIFDATQSSTTLEDSELSFEWFFGDGNRQQGGEVVHSYSNPGEYEVTLIVRDNQENQVSYTHDLFVYERSFVLITNVIEEQDRITRFVESARNEFVYIDLIEAYESQSEFLEEEDLEKQIFERIGELETVEQIVTWTEGSSGLTVFSQLQQNVSDENFFAGKEIIFVSEEDFGSLGNLARGVFDSIHPDEIILTRSESVWVLMETNSTEDFVNILDERGIQYERVTESLNIRPWNIMSHFVNTMIDRGVPTNTIRLILMLPVIVTVVAFMKQVVGLATLGVYTPSILALSFIALDLSYGLIILFSILFIGTLTRLFLRRYRLLYIPRMAIVLTVVSLTILMLLFFGAYFNVSSAIGLAVFPMLIMSTMVEKFVSIQSGKGLRSALTLVGEMVLVAILCYYVAEWSWLKVVILGHPEIIFLFLVINVILARWSGLRLMEYFRFREIIRYAEE